MRSNIVIVTVTLFAVAGMLPAKQQQAVKDSERIINVDELTVAMQKATRPVADRMASTQLEQQFDQVTRLLEQDEVDKQQLLNSLRGLQQEIHKFTDDWESVTAPLWEGQETIGKTVDKVRKLLASGGGKGQLSKKTQESLQNYDQRLHQLAKTIKSEKDPIRKARLKKVFANVLALRKLASQLGGVDMGSANAVLQAKIIRALSGLQDQLTQATFEVEKARLVLASEHEFIENYVAVLEGMMEAERLAKVLGDMRSEGKDFAGLSVDVNSLKENAQDFAATMNSFAGRMADSIETQTARLEQSSPGISELEGVNVDAEIEKYLSETVIERSIVVE